MPYETWLPAQAPTYMQDPIGQAWLGGLGAAMDDYLAQFVAAVLSAFPGYAAPDALNVVGNEMGIVRGPVETDANYLVRVAGAWGAWQWAGSPVGILAGLYWAGFGGAVLVQQNGLAYQLTGTMVAGTDPHANLVVTPTSTLVVPMHNDRDLTRSIPVGTQWWTMDSHSDHCSRFEVLYPGSSPFLATFGTATFTGTEDGSALNPWPIAAWNNVFSDTTYVMQPSAPTITDGHGPVVITPDPASKTGSGCAMAASSPFVGTVDVLAYQAGALNPWADPHPQDLSRLQRVLLLWKGAKARCSGIFALTQGNFVGWPVRLTGAAAPGPSVVTRLAGGF